MTYLPDKIELLDTRKFEDQFGFAKFYNIRWDLRITKSPTQILTLMGTPFNKEGKLRWDVNLYARCTHLPKVDYYALQSEIFPLQFSYNNITYYGQALLNGFDIGLDDGYVWFEFHFTGVGELISVRRGIQPNTLPQENPPLNSGQLALPNPDRKEPQ